MDKVFKSKLIFYFSDGSTYECLFMDGEDAGETLDIIMENKFIGGCYPLDSHTEIYINLTTVKYVELVDL